jgi:hypothetical protein
MTTPTTERLAQALAAADAPAQMIEQARAGYFDDYKSPLAMPLNQLVATCRNLAPSYPGLTGIAERVIDGEFDSTKEESDEWARSPEGQEAFRQLVEPRPNRAQRRHPR